MKRQKAKKSFGQIIKEARLKKQFTQTQLAVAADTTQANVTLIERRKRLPGMFLLRRIALALDLSPENLKDARINEDAEQRRQTQEAEFVQAKKKGK